MKHLRLFEEFVNTEYEELEVKQSSIPNSGRGLFTLVDIDEGSKIAEFNT